MHNFPQLFALQHPANEKKQKPLAIDLISVLLLHSGRFQQNNRPFSNKKF